MSGSPAPPSSSSSAPAPEPFRGPDSRLGELLLDVLPLACAVGHALDLSHCLALCGATWRRGVARADGSLDRAGFLGGAADMIRSAGRLQGLDAMRAKGREGSWTQLIRAAHTGDEKRVRELVAAGAKLDLVCGSGWSALHYASARGHVRIAKLLLDGKYEGKGADVNLRSRHGYAPLTYSSSDAMKALLHAHGATL